MIHQLYEVGPEGTSVVLAQKMPRGQASCSRADLRGRREWAKVACVLA
jgi:hypothetical protein